MHVGDTRALTRNMNKHVEMCKIWQPGTHLRTLRMCFLYVFILLVLKGRNGNNSVPQLWGAWHSLNLQINIVILFIEFLGVRPPWSPRIARLLLILGCFLLFLWWVKTTLCVQNCTLPAHVMTDFSFLSRYVPSQYSYLLHPCLPGKSFAAMIWRVSRNMFAITDSVVHICLESLDIIRIVCEYALSIFETRSAMSTFGLLVFLLFVCRDT